MQLDELQKLWSEDCLIDSTQLGHEALNTPIKHAKYINIMSSVKLQLRKAMSDYDRLRRNKFRYYRGEMSKDELSTLGWSQWQGTKPLKNEMDEFLQGDEDLIKLQDKIAYIEAIHFQLEQIIRSINSRGWDIKSAIEWAKFTNGIVG